MTQWYDSILINTYKPLAWFRLLASAIVLAATIKADSFVSEKMQGGSFPWWAYLALAVLLICAVIADWLIEEQQK